eukprot:jgi/Tetstr1/444546/TSEL_000276.t1
MGADLMPLAVRKRVSGEPATGLLPGGGSDARPSPALTRVSRGVSLLNVAELAGASGSPVKSPVKVPAGNKAFAAAVRRGAAELNAAHAEGNVLVLAFAPYAKEDSNWRKTWLTHCLGLSRGQRDAAADIMWHPACLEGIQVLPFPLAAGVCSTIERWLNAGSSQHHVLLLVDNGAAGWDLLGFLAAAYHMYASAMDAKKAVALAQEQLPSTSPCFSGMSRASQQRYLSYFSGKATQLWWPPREKT